MTEAIKGKAIEEAEHLFDGFREMVTSAPNAPAGGGELGKLSVFSGVREFPMRVKCATLAWHALREALHESGDTATTE
jgi:nitrogen fixation NifU-like protein